MNTNITLQPGDVLTVTAATATPPVPNKLPIVSAGIDQQIKLPVSEVTLKATVSDSDGTIASQLWTKLSGPAAIIATPAAQITKVTGMIAGDYSFRFTATDDKSGKSADDINIKVLAADPVPVVFGKYLSLPTSGIRDISGQSNLIIENLRFNNTQGACIKAFGSNNITIRNCFFNGSTREAIDMNGSNNITIINCLFARVETGVYALNCNTVKINLNQFLNVRRRIGDGGGRGQFVQFNSCGGAGNEIMNNRGENWAGESDPEDLISLYRSSGTAASPIKISGNMFRGGGPSGSGGGIIAGDNGGGEILMENNVLLDPGQYGMAVAGGENIKILNNKIFAKQQPFTNNPLYVWRQDAETCANITVTGNFVNWTDRDGNKNNGWNAGNCGSSYNPDENKTISLAEMGVPVHLIDFVTPAELLTIRK